MGLRSARSARAGHSKEGLMKKHFLKFVGLVFRTSHTVTRGVCAQDEGLGIGAHPDFAIGVFPTRCDWPSGAAWGAAVPTTWRTMSFPA